MGRYWVLLGFNGLNTVLPGFSWFDWVLPSFTGFYRVLLGLSTLTGLKIIGMGRYWVLLGFPIFLFSAPLFPSISSVGFFKRSVKEKEEE